MNSRTPELSRLTLMCRDHEVAEFTWNHDHQTVTGKTHIIDAAHAPLMSTDPSGNITRDSSRAGSRTGAYRISGPMPSSACAQSASRRPHPSWPPASGPLSPINTGSAPPGHFDMARRQLLRERFQRKNSASWLLRTTASSVPSAHREDQGQCGHPRVLARCGTERQPPEALDGRGRPPGARQSRPAIQQVPGTVQREDRQRAVLAPAR